MGAWIETDYTKTRFFAAWSHPVWVRGLKRFVRPSDLATAKVAPRVGAWIETDDDLFEVCSNRVAPRVGAWIETRALTATENTLRVAPRVGAWIETKSSLDA